MDIFRQSFPSKYLIYRIMKFGVHLQVDKVYCVNENKDSNLHFAVLFFKFALCHSYITHMDIFDQNFLTNYLIKDYKTFNDFVDFLKVLQPLMTTARGM